MSATPLLDVVVWSPPGEVLMSLILRLSAEHGAMIQPRVTVEGAHLPLPHGSFLRGSGELRVTSIEGGTRVSVLGVPPPWPLRLGWARRILRRYAGGVIAARTL